MKDGRRWTTLEDAFLREFWGSIPGPHVAERLHRTLRAVQHRASALGLRAYPERPSREEFVRLCADHTTPELAAKFGVTYQCIAQWGKNYGCKPKAAKRGGPRTHPALTSTTPRRLCYGPQPNHLEWPEWI